MNAVLRLVLVPLILTFFHNVNGNEAKSNGKGSVRQNTIKDSSPKVLEHASFIIEENRVGPFIIGNEEPATLFGDFLIETKIRIIAAEGDEYEETFFLLLEHDQEVLTFQTKQDKPDNTITEIIVKSKLIKTKDNIGVGSTLEDFIAAYPNYSLWYTYVGDMFVIQGPFNNVQFLIDAKDYNGSKDLYHADSVELEIADFKAHTRVSSIRLY